MIYFVGASIPTGKSHVEMRAQTEDTGSGSGEMSSASGNKL